MASRASFPLSSVKRPLLFLVPEILMALRVALPAP
jgi:hypothetical protein